MSDSVTDLEIRLTHQEAALEELTRTVLEQEQRIRRLTEELQSLRLQLQQFSPLAHPGEETPPPHY